MTIQERIAQEEAARKEWEAKTMVGAFSIAELRTVSDAVFNKDNWKAAWQAEVHHSMVLAVITATEFFHADIAEVHGVAPLTGYVLMSGKGYQAD